MAVLRAYRRFVVVAVQFLPLLVAYARDRKRFILFGSGRTVDTETRRRRARSLLESLLTLGPTFIKLGQLLSTRPDVLPPEYIEEFEELQDRVPPAEWTDAKRVLEEELGPVEESFDEFDTDAISGASLGQVHVAELDGEQVAVKIRRPGVESLVEADLWVISTLLPLLMRFVDDSRSFSMETLANEFSRVIRDEMDYRREREMLREIRANFEGDDRLRIPDVYEDRSTDRVLTMEYVPGTKINDIDSLDDLDVDRTRLAETLQRVYLQMIVDDGVFHADPHPGNLAVQDDGTLVFYDFGMSDRVDPFVQEKIIDFYVAIARQDTDAVLDTLVSMGTLSPDADREVMSEVMELAIADARGEDIEQYRVQQIVMQIEDTLYEFPLRLPPNLALVLRVATVVEGVCVTLDPEFDFITVATEYLGEEGYIEEGVRDAVRDTGTQLSETTQSLFRVPPKLEDVLDTVERGNLEATVEFPNDPPMFRKLASRLIYGILLAFALPSTALLYLFASLQVTVVAAVLALGLVVLLYRSFTKSSSSISAQPQFTRQNLNRRDE
ncbi:AarF/ABC1/UbiB kinase family protein [Halosegnis rubeus]|uniref:AarF/ABC1/UbiB kinase family protein n=1 Tax=Halosegnis rubeus TaxID=2212850 RepID=A0A5N5UF55_9EURY|nr:AarF/ABC1/UbiB kinase family protein [Halosegnis rubeus]KAB7515866.1 AarF/ABC1/UbiB kinase family protein [Halosegnis rubeus]KAB7516919.1 AarF/ABC1/UbiB kinase family protein [Halosegnis rubeus]KAB7519952.1 AarF/ABC1/UbiB kinase family protein [Halosegnis rubeus]